MKKFNTFQGVFIPSTNAILGTVFFLLLPSLTADTGFLMMSLIIIIAHSVTFATAFSLADCATNLNTIGPGGMYAISKRSLGKSLGGSIGIQLYFAQAASIGFYCIGFAEPLQPILAYHFSDLYLFNDMSSEGIMLQKQILASAIVIAFLVIVMLGADFTLRIQSLILIILMVSTLTIVFSPFLGFQFESESIFQNSLSKINLSGNRAMTFAIFFTAFTQFFPAVTGIDAGVGMSGDLKDPKKSLVKGTFLAIAITFIVYLICTMVFAFIKKEFLIESYVNGNPQGKLLTEIFGLSKVFPENLFALFILSGILFATSSSALSCFMTAPRTAQSLSKDSVLPDFLKFLKADFFKDGREPRYASILTFFVAFGIIWMGSINLAAMIVGICFLAVYGWVNGSAFLERISGNPSFRPTSKGHWLISLYGFLTCLLIILLFDWLVGIFVILSQYVIFQMILRNKSESRLEGVWWGVTFSFINRGIKSLAKIEQGSKNWRPFLTTISFSSKVNHPDKMEKISEMIASFKGLVNMNIIKSEKEKIHDFNFYQFSIPTNTLISGDFTETTMALIQSASMGGLRQNSILLEFSKKLDCVKVLKTALNLNQNVLLLKNAGLFNKCQFIDIWWRGERNGNLMVLLAYIMMISEKTHHSEMKIRIIRKLSEDENSETASTQMHHLLESARLSGEVFILPESEEPFHEIVRQVSRNAEIIMMGLPGDFLEDTNKKKIFSLNEFFFAREIHKFDDLPPILFVKSANTVKLIDD